MKVHVRIGTLAEVREALGAREIHEFGGIEPNPSHETLMKAVELIREQKIDFLMAVGGGSVTSFDGHEIYCSSSQLYRGYM